MVWLEGLPYRGRRHQLSERSGIGKEPVEGANHDARRVRQIHERMSLGRQLVGLRYVNETRMGRARPSQPQPAQELRIAHLSQSGKGRWDLKQVLEPAGHLVADRPHDVQLAAG